MDRFEVETQRSTSVKGKPGTPDSDQGQQLGNGIMWLVEFQMRRRPDIGFSRTEQRV